MTFPNQVPQPMDRRPDRHENANPNPARGSKSPVLREAQKHHAAGDAHREACVGGVLKRESLDSAIECYEQALALYPMNAPAHIHLINNLGCALLDRYQIAGAEQDLARATELLETAIRTSCQSSEDLAILLDNLHVCIVNQFQFTQDPQYLNRAAELFANYAQARTEVATSQRGLLASARTASLEYQQSGNRTDLEHAIDQYQQAIKRTPAQCSTRALSLNSLGELLRWRYKLTGDIGELDRAIATYRQAATEAPQGSLCYGVSLGGIGTTLRQRYELTGSIADLDQAIKAGQAAEKLLPPDAPSRGPVVANLANGLFLRYERTLQAQDIQDGIRYLEVALGQRPAHTPPEPMIMALYGNALRMRFERDKNIDDLGRAIINLERASELLGRDSPDYAWCLSSLGSAFLSRYVKTNRAADLERAISCFERTIQMLPKTSVLRANPLISLGIALHNRYWRKHRASDWERGRAALEKALHIARDTSIRDALAGARIWGRWAMERRDWADAVEAYGHALEIIEELQRAHVLREDKESWLREVEGLYECAAYCQAKLGELYQAVSTLERGRAQLLAETLERDRVELQQVESIAPEACRRYQEAAKALRMQLAKSMLPSGRDDDAEEPRRAACRQARARLDAAIAEIRQYTGLHDFLEPPEFEDLESTVTPEAPVVYIATTHLGGIAIIVCRHTQAHDFETADNSRTRGDPGVLHQRTPTLTFTPVWLDELTDGTVRDWLFGDSNTDAASDRGYLTVYQQWREHFTPQLEERWHQELERCTEALWQHCMEAILFSFQRIDNTQVKQVIFIPGGLLALLPLHAAWIDTSILTRIRRQFRRMEDRISNVLTPLLRTLLGVQLLRLRLFPLPLLVLMAISAHLVRWLRRFRKTQTCRMQPRRWANDTLAVSYIPSLRALKHAYELTHEADPRHRRYRCLVVSEPRNSGVILEGAEQEALAVIGHFQAKNIELRGGDCTPSNVLDALKCAEVWHFACHGETKSEEPLESHLKLAYGKPLSVRELMAAHVSNARLAVLSACETGIVGQNIPNEVVALPAAMMQAGCAGIIATLWAVSDWVTTLLMIRFYEEWRQNGLAPTQALWRAQTWIRDTTNGEKKYYFERMHPELANETIPVTSKDRCKPCITLEVAAALHWQICASAPSSEHDRQSSIEHGRRFATSNCDREAYWQARDHESPIYWAGFYLTGV